MFRRRCKGGWDACHSHVQDLALAVMWSSTVQSCFAIDASRRYGWCLYVASAGTGLCCVFLFFISKHNFELVQKVADNSWWHVYSNGNRSMVSTEIKYLSCLFSMGCLASFDWWVHWWDNFSMCILELICLLEQLHVWVWNTQDALHSKTSARLSTTPRRFNERYGIESQKNKNESKF